MISVDEERVTENDKVLIAITNQYMFDQVMWYHSIYPEGVWDAVVVLFGDKDLADIMYQKCVNSGIFSKVYLYTDWRCRPRTGSLLQKIYLTLMYFWQYITCRREISDKKLIEEIVGDCDYKKVVIQSRFSAIPVAMVNAMNTAVLVCLEDGMTDYCPIVTFDKIHNFRQLIPGIFAKWNVLSYVSDGCQFCLKHDGKMIKYSSLPEKMKYKGFKKIKQLFEMEDGFFNCEAYGKKLDESYDMVLFSSAWSDYGNEDIIYETLHAWLKEHHKNKKIFIKPHPRETYRFLWDDLDVTVGMLDVSGETALDVLSNAEVYFLYTSAILLKACREKRPFKVIYFNNFHNQRYFAGLKAISEVLGLKEENWIVLGENTNGC